MPPQAEGQQPTTPRDYLIQQAEALGIPPDFALAMVAQESGGDQGAISPKGAVGFFQLMPETAAELGVDPTDPFQNITGGLRYFKQQLDAHDGDIQLALAAFNAGPGAVAEAGGIPDFPETQDYVTRVLERWQGEEVTVPGAAPVTEVEEFGTPRVSSSAPGAIARKGSDPLPPPPARLTAGAGPGALHMAVRSFVRAKPGESNLAATGRHAVAGGRAMAEALDPRTFEGRVNIAGALGGALTGGGVTAARIGVGVAVKTGVLPWIARILAAPTGAAVVAGAEAKAEELLGTAPEGINAAWEGVKQGVYEAGGRLFMWPFRRGGAMAKARKVGDPAREALEAGVAQAERTGKAAVDAVQSATEGVSSTMRMLREAETIASRERAATGAQVATTTAQRTGAPQAARALNRVVAGELEVAGQITQLTRQYDNLLGQAPQLVRAGTDVAATMRGPAQRALDAAGQRVTDVAAEGPEVALAGVKEALEGMAERARPAVIFGEQAAEQKGAGFLANIRGAGQQAAGSDFDPANLNKLVADALGIDPTKMPPKLPGLLGKIANAPDEISFADAHQIKRLLDEAVNWDKTAKKHLEQITKGLRTTLREAMASYEPYNEATAIYSAMVPLYRKGIGQRILKLAQQPDGAARIAQSLATQDPSQALALKTLMIAQATAGGNPQLGRQAWDGVREAFTHQKVITGGIEGLSGRVRKLLTEHSEFAVALYDDESGRRILSNLDRIGTRFDELLVGRVESRVVGREAVGVAKKADVGLVRAGAQVLVDAEKKVLAEFKASSAGKPMSKEQLFADSVRALALGPFQIWGLLSMARIGFSARGADLLRWAAYSDANTQTVLKILYGKMPDRGMALAIRSITTAVTGGDLDEANIPPPPAPTPEP